MAFSRAPKSTENKGRRLQHCLKVGTLVINAVIFVYSTSSK